MCIRDRIGDSPGSLQFSFWNPDQHLLYLLKQVKAFLVPALRQRKRYLKNLSNEGNISDSHCHHDFCDHFPDLKSQRICKCAKRRKQHPQAE